jgi:hypothetical protein
VGDGIYGQAGGRERLERASDLGVELGVEEVVAVVCEAEGGAQEGFGCGAVGGVAGLWVSLLLTIYVREEMGVRLTL